MHTHTHTHPTNYYYIDTVLCCSCGLLLLPRLDPVSLLVSLEEEGECLGFLFASITLQSYIQKPRLSVSLYVLSGCRFFFFLLFPLQSIYISSQCLIFFGVKVTAPCRFFQEKLIFFLFFWV